MAATVATVLTVAGCSSSAGGTSTAPGSTGAGDNLRGQTITVYSGQHEQTTQALVTDFEARTGVAVQLRSDDEAALAGQLLQEGSASPADVFYAENPPALTAVQDRGMLSAVDPSVLAQVPAAASSTHGDWVGVSARTAAFAVNTSVPVAQRPHSVFDLAGRPWAGKLGLAPGETDFAPVVTEVARARGVAAATRWLSAVKANARIYPDNETLIAAVNRGEVLGGLVDHYYFYRLRDEVGAGRLTCALQYFAKGDPGAFVDVSGAGVLRSSSHPEAAQAFLAYLVSAPAQHIIATSHSYEYPLRPGVNSAAGLRPLSEVGSIVSPATLGDGTQALALLQQVGLL